ncbi:MAG: amidohydrolase, partial [Acidimicrobiales bacterium]
MRRPPSRIVLLGTLITACAPKADILVIGRAVWTGTADRPAPGAVAIAHGRIAAVGDSAALTRFIGPRTELIVAGDGLVMPGFADGHTHFIDGGVQLASVDLRTADSPQEFVRRLGEYARSLRPGEWITGGDWDHEWWPGAPLPRRAWIDSVTPDNPVFVSRLDQHMALANSAALRAAGVTGETAAPPGGEVVRDPRSGEPLGIFKDNAQNLIWRAIPAPSPERRDSALARALAHAASLGVTAVAHVSASMADLASYRRLASAGRMTLRVTLFFPLATWREVADSVRRSAGDDWVRIGGVKGYVDGSAGSRT